MLAKYTVTYGYWKKISGAGQTGSAWLKNTEDGSARIAIAHTETVQTPADNILWASAVDLDREIAYYLPQDFQPSAILEADSPTDIFYATLLDADETAEIIVDFA